MIQFNIIDYAPNASDIMLSVSFKLGRKCIPKQLIVVNAK